MDDKDAEIAALKHDIERAQAALADMATENEKLRAAVDDLTNLIFREAGAQEWVRRCEDWAEDNAQGCAERPAPIFGEHWSDEAYNIRLKHFGPSRQKAKGRNDERQL